MKKYLCLVLAAVMSLSAICAASGCSSGSSSQSSASVTSAENTQNASAESATTDDNVKAKVLNYPEYKEYNLETDVPIKNIIIMIGDGMGANHIKAAELQKGDKLNMEIMKYQGESVTLSLDGITDSAAAATAISCGYKTHNKSIAVDGDGNSVENLFEFAKSNNMKTGIAMTEFIPHATPAAFSSHDNSRDDYKQIFYQQLDNQVNVMLGGGQRFYNDGLVRKMESNNYKYITTSDELNAFDKSSSRNLIGMFKYEMVLAGYSPSLSTMTSKALDLLENDNGFCLMVEGSDIDTRAAKCDMQATLREMTVFDQAVATVLEYAQDNPGTLVIVTADHETGGLEFGDDTTYDELSDKMFTSGGEHTDKDVRIFADGAQADKFLTSDVIDNTDIAKQIRYLYNGSMLKEPFEYVDYDIAANTSDAQ